MEVIAARGFEKDTHSEQAASDIRALPKLEGTVHVNLALVLKFLPQYLMASGEYADVPVRQDAADDEYLFAQATHPASARSRSPRGAPRWSATSTCPTWRGSWSRSTPSQPW